MKKITIFLIFIFFILSCANKNKRMPFYSAVIDKENNDSIQTSTVVSAQRPIIGYFNKKDNIDADYYKVLFPLKNTSYKVLLSAVPGIDSKITFFDNNGKIKFTVDEYKKGESEKLWGYKPKNDFIFIRVEPKVGFNKKVPYVINFIPSQKAPIDEIEPNNIQENATLIRLDDTKKGLISPKDDVDWYKLIINTNKIFDFSIKVETLSNIDISFSVVGIKSNIKKFINTHSWGGTEYFPYLSSNKGNFLIRISGNIKPYDRKDPVYYLQITKLTSSDNKEYYEREINDSSDKATTLINGSDTVGSFFPKDDVDWYQFELFKKPIRVDISLTGIQGCNTTVEVYDKNKNLIVKIDKNGTSQKEEESLTQLSRGKYFINIFSDVPSTTIYKLFFNARYNK